jgi:hypothetical protein
MSTGLCVNRFADQRVTNYMLDIDAGTDQVVTCRWQYGELPSAGWVLLTVLVGKRARADV